MTGYFNEERPKMPRCPECRIDIDTLLIIQKVLKIEEMDGEGHRSDYDLETIDEPTYCCPWCKKALFTKWGDAIRFLSTPQ